jgi:hypothetical protein
MIKGQQVEAREKKQRELIEKQMRAKQQIEDKMMREEQKRIEHQSMIERMIVHAEKYAFVDYGHRFWLEQFRLSDERDPSGMAKHCHLTICRQRMLTRLCFPKQWSAEHKMSLDYCCSM